MSRVLVIGCGGVASVAIQKCCQADEVFTELCIASRTKEKCDALARKLEGKTKTVVTTAKVDADDVNQLFLFRHCQQQFPDHLACCGCGKDRKSVV